jgi:E3 ubiquitin-protein ligase HUWE1
LRLLALPSLPRDEYLATLRILVHLTRNEETSRQFAQRDGLSLLFQSFKKLSGLQGASACQSYTAILLRHITEDNATLERFMRQEVKRLLSHPRGRDGEHISTYVRHCVPLASRDPQLFLNVTKSLCKLSSPDPTAKICLRRNANEPESSDEKPTMPSEGNSMQVDNPTLNINNIEESAEAIIHFLLNELLRAGKAASEGIKNVQTSAQAQDTKKEAIATLHADPAEPIQQTSASETIREGGQETNSASQSDFHYACFLMQCLTELLFSYDRCKTAFLSFGKKKGHSHGKEGHARVKPAALTFLLSDLVSVGAFNSEAKFDTKKRVMLCNWAMSVIVALCVESSPQTSTLSGNASDLLTVRKAVLDAISKAIRDTPQGESIDARYGRLLALADLCHRLLTVRFNAGVSGKGPEETPLHLAKMMLEKNFVATLTNVLSAIDLNYPNVRSLVSAVLRPLEHL